MTIGVRKLCSETATGLSQREYHTVSTAGTGLRGREGESLRGGQNFFA